MNIKSLILPLSIIFLLILGVVLVFSYSSSLTKKEAIERVLLAYPELSLYETANLPPSEIESKQTTEGWYLGFVRKGSGRPGVIDARCFFVNNDRKISSTGEYVTPVSQVVESVDIQTCAPENVSEEPIETDIGLKFGEQGIFEGVTIRPIEIMEDSRCPVDVQCIQAGTVRLKTEIISNNKKTTATVVLGQEFTFESAKVTLVSVLPAKDSRIKVLSSDYRFVFTVSTESPSVSLGKCYIGGCSSQICSDTPDVVSTCEYKEEYACYQKATCERQANGECGWTATLAFTQCIQNNR